MGHADVNIPAELLHSVGALLDEFDKYLQQKGYESSRGQKQWGRHVTPWWLYLTLSNKAVRRSRLQFGETRHASVNPAPHMWVRGSADFIATGKHLLRCFIATKAARMPALTQMPTVLQKLAPGRREHPSASRGVAMHSFSGHDYGDEYLTFTAGDVVDLLPVPAGVRAEGWAYGALVNARCEGWSPPTYVRPLAANQAAAPVAGDKACT